MARKRKTLEQKRRADQHRPLPQTDNFTPSQSSSPTPFTYSFSQTSQQISPQAKQQIPSTAKISTIAISYQYAQADLRKTFFTTVAIILAQIILLFVLRK